MLILYIFQKVTDSASLDLARSPQTEAKACFSTCRKAATRLNEEVVVQQNVTWAAWPSAVLKVDKVILLPVREREGTWPPQRPSQGDQVRLPSPPALRAWIRAGEVGCFHCSVSLGAFNHSVPAFYFGVSHCEKKTGILRRFRYCILRRHSKSFGLVFFHPWDKIPAPWVLTVSS